MTGSLRWRIAVLIGAAIAISYFDRQTLPVAITAIQREIPITNTQFSQLQAAFLMAYAVMYAGGGKLVDVLGTRAGFLRDHGLVVAGLRQPWPRDRLRHAGGQPVPARRWAKAAAFPAATKAVAEWFPARERSTAMGIINAGTAVGRGDRAAAHRAASSPR